MNGITIPKKKLTPAQIKKLQDATGHGQAYKWCVDNGVSFPSMKAARDGEELSEIMIKKIIKAL